MRIIESRSRDEMANFDPPKHSVYLKVTLEIVFIISRIGEKEPRFSILLESEQKRGRYDFLETRSEICRYSISRENIWPVVPQNARQYYGRSSWN